MQFTQRVLTTTQDKIVPKTFDNFLSDNFVTFRFVGNGQKWVGETLKFPVKIAKNTNGGSFSGLDPHSVDAVETRQLLQYNLKAYEIDVAIPGLDRLVNASEAQVINLVKTEMESSAQDGMDDVADIFYGDGTGNGSKDFEGVGNLIDDTVSIGGLSRSTYPTLVSELLAFGGTMTLTKLATVFSGASGGSASKQKPTLIDSDQTVWDLYESLLSPTVRANYEATGLPVVTRSSSGAIPAAQMKGAAGYTSLIYRGVPWVANQKATSQSVFMYNENYLEWYGINDPEMTQPDFGSAIDGTYAEIPSKYSGLNWSGLMKPINQYGVVGHIYLFGNFVTSQPRRLGKGTGITGV
jgi:hypothetical protein